VIIERNYRKAKVWLGTLPDVSYPVDSIARRSISVTSQVVQEERCAAIEVVAGTGARILYGFLGGSFEPSPKGTHVTIEIAVAAAKVKATLEGTIAPRTENVRLGLPRLYGEDVMTGVMSTPNLHLLGPGTVRIDRAAYGAYGSAPVVFRWLGRAVGRLLLRGNTFDGDADLAAFVFDGQPGIGGV
jgi:hypothetical protein